MVPRLAELALEMVFPADNQTIEILTQAVAGNVLDDRFHETNRPELPEVQPMK